MTGAWITEGLLLTECPSRMRELLDDRHQFEFFLKPYTH